MPGAGAARRPRVLLIAPASSYRIVPYLEAAARLGLDITLASQGEHSLIAAVAHGIQIPLDRPDEAVHILCAHGREHPLAGVFGSDDASVELAGRVAAELGLPHNPPEAARISRRKDLARARLAAAGLPVPRHRRIALDRPLAAQIAGFPFPCVVKPLALSGSRGVIRADDALQLAAACARIAPLLDELHDPEERGHVLLETFLPGREVALEGLLEDGRLEVITLFDKPEPLDGPYFEESYYITPSRLSPARQARCALRVQQACTAYGLRTGPIHAELRVHEDDAWILEVASRTIGGQCARLLQFGAGARLEELVLARLTGRQLPPHQMAGGAGVLMIPIPRAGILRRVEGVLAASRVAYVDEVEISVREGYELVPLPDGASYLGFIFAHAPDSGQAERALRQAHACLNIVTATLLPTA